MDNKYKYTYEKTADYCYKDTDVLINKLNITNDEDLYNAERELVSLRVSAFNDNPLKGNFDFNYLKAIHISLPLPLQSSHPPISIFLLYELLI